MQRNGVECGVQPITLDPPRQLKAAHQQARGYVVNNQLLPIRQMELNKEIMKLKGDEKTAAADKTAKLAELEKQFAEVGRQIDARKK